MLSLVTGNIFDSDKECLVNPVNCEGVMGKGLALEFRRRFPDLFRDYQTLCGANQITVGRVHFWSSIEDPLETVCLFPTKKHWRDKSNVDWIDAGLAHFAQEAIQEDLRSAAFPMLGCGLGGLHFKHQVLPLFVKYFASHPLVIDVYVGL